MKNNNLSYKSEENKYIIPDSFNIEKEEKESISPILQTDSVNSFKEPREMIKTSIISSLGESTENQHSNPIENSENTIEQSELLDIPNIKLNLFFEPDEKSLATLQQYYQRIKDEFGDIIFERKEESLPFHFTIIGN